MDQGLRERLVQFGMSGADIAWFDSFGCDDARVPVPRAEEIPDYRRREGVLNASIAGLSVGERGDSREGRLAAAIGARVADLLDQAESDED